MNLGFETEDATAIGLPESWVISTTSFVERAGYGVDETVHALSPYDSFETEWDSNEGWQTGDFTVGDVADALYDTEDFEDFEEGWASYTTSPPVTLASYDTGTPEAVEDFEEQWDSNEGWVTGDLPGGSKEQASYDTGSPEAVEDFEEQWDSNESYTTSFAGIGFDLEAAEYDASTGGAGEAFEDFEEVEPARPFTVADLALDRIFIENHGLIAGYDITFVNDLGRLPDGLSEGFTYEVKDIVDSDHVTLRPPGVASVTIDIIDHGIGYHRAIYDRGLFWVTHMEE